MDCDIRIHHSYSYVLMHGVSLTNAPNCCPSRSIIPSAPRSCFPWPAFSQFLSSGCSTSASPLLWEIPRGIFGSGVPLGLPVEWYSLPYVSFLLSLLFSSDISLWPEGSPTLCSPLPSNFHGLFRKSLACLYHLGNHLTQWHMDWQVLRLSKTCSSKCSRTWTSSETYWIGIFF